jgi:hypothetical protein
VINLYILTAKYQKMIVHPAIIPLNHDEFSGYIADGLFYISSTRKDSPNAKVIWEFYLATNRPGFYHVCFDMNKETGSQPLLDTLLRLHDLPHMGGSVFEDTSDVGLIYIDIGNSAFYPDLSRNMNQRIMPRMYSEMNDTSWEINEVYQQWELAVKTTAAIYGRDNVKMNCSYTLGWEGGDVYFASVRMDIKAEKDFSIVYTTPILVDQTGLKGLERRVRETLNSI